MRAIFVTLLTLALCGSAIAEDDLQVIPLSKPNLEKGSSLMKALSVRSSQREFAKEMLSREDLSDLLWAANGINRPDKEGRTAPSALNKQEIDIYVAMEEGTYYYNYKENILILKSSKDLRPAIAAQQAYVADAPVILLMVGNLTKVGKRTEKSETMVAIDAGIVCQNINIFCASRNLATVPRASMEVDTIKRELQLDENQLVLLNNPVGYKTTK